MHNFLITGAGFGNKGAQSMLFVTAYELTRRFPDCNVYFATSELYPQEDYSFRKLYYSGRSVRVALGGLNGMKALFGGYARDIVKFLLGRSNILLEHYHDLAKHLPHMTAVVDISGFALSSKWGNCVPSGYINQIAAARKYSVPVYLMPQSFGPFDYTPDVMQQAVPALQNILQYPRIIFAREKQGFDALMQICPLKQLRLSTDLVLQNKEVKPENIFTVPPVISVPEIPSSKELAGIVPNMRCFDHGSKAQILEAYRKIIDYISGQGYGVVLFRHSVEDIEACRLLKSFYPDNEDVVLLQNDFNCFEYSEFVKQFKFLVCSRYHGLVHAYKNNIPCIALGWAEKYRSLAENLGQGSYVFDITSAQIDTSGILGSISQLLTRYDSERRTIREKLSEIQSHNCFDILEEDLRKTGAVK